jgi:hypothetical protein
MDWKLRADGATAEETAGVMNSFCVFWPEIFLPNICTGPSRIREHSSPFLHTALAAAGGIQGAGHVTVLQ